MSCTISIFEHGHLNVLLQKQDLNTNTLLYRPIKFGEEVGEYNSPHDVADRAKWKWYHAGRAMQHLAPR